MEDTFMKETSEWNEKLYRMLMTAYDDRGDPFWGILEELALINHWNDDTFASGRDEAKAEAALVETIPEAQELMRELMERGLVYITRTQGWPPPSSGVARVTAGEVEAIIADAQNWLGPLVEGPDANYYSFCSTIPGETITQESVKVKKV